jgi:hypothetical protein
VAGKSKQQVQNRRIRKAEGAGGADTCLLLICYAKEAEQSPSYTGPRAASVREEINFATTDAESMSTESGSVQQESACSRLAMLRAASNADACRTE